MAHTRAMVNQRRLTCRQHFVCSEGWLPALPLSQLRFPLEEQLSILSIPWHHNNTHVRTSLAPSHLCTSPRPARLPRQQVIKRRCIHMLNIREVVSQEESSALLRRELDYLSTSDRQILLQEAGIVSAIGPGGSIGYISWPWNAMVKAKSA